MAVTRLPGVKLTEKQFMAQVIQFAKLRGWLVYHTHNSQRSEPGFPDLVMVRGSRIIFAELKRDGAQLTTAQEKWLTALEATPAEEWAWWPDDWPAIERTLS